MLGELFIIERKQRCLGTQHIWQSHNGKSREELRVTDEGIFHCLAFHLDIPTIIFDREADTGKMKNEQRAALSHRQTCSGHSAPQ